MYFANIKSVKKYFLNADKKDIRDLIELWNLKIEKEFDNIYDRIRFHGKHNNNNDENKNDNKHDEFQTYLADNSDKWAT